MPKQDQKQGDQQMQQKGGKQSQQQGGSGQSPGSGTDVQGEGNYTAAREYDEAQRKFVESGRVEDAAHKAAPKSPEEAEEMKRAEQEGKRHAKEEDPALRRGGGSDSERH